MTKTILISLKNKKLLIRKRLYQSFKKNYHFIFAKKFFKTFKLQVNLVNLLSVKEVKSLPKRVRTQLFFYWSVLSSDADNEVHRICRFCCLCCCCNQNLKLSQLCDRNEGGKAEFDNENANQILSLVIVTWTRSYHLQLLFEITF